MTRFARQPSAGTTSSVWLTTALQHRSVVYLSPHSDDAAYSSDLFLQTCAASDVPIHIVTVFSRSGYTSSSHSSPVGQTTRLRKAEDRQYGTRLGSTTRMSWLDLCDAPLRSGHTVATTCLESPITAEDRTLIEELRARLCAVFTPATIPVIPLGLGNHIDHRITKDAAIGVLAGLPVPVIVYEDLPYAADAELQAIDADIEKLSNESGRAFVPVIIPSARLQPKRHSVALYTSQLHAGTESRIEYHAARVGKAGVPAERLWLSWPHQEEAQS